MKRKWFLPTCGGNHRCVVVSRADGMVAGLVLYHDGLVLRHEGLHDAPADEVSHSTEAEDNHVGGRLAVEAHEGECCSLFGSPGKELTGTHIDGHRAEAAGHGAQTYKGADGRLGEHVAYGREEVG